MQNDIPAKAFIFGATDLAILLYQNLQSLSYNNVEAFVVDDDFYDENLSLKIPVIKVSKATAFFDPEEYGCYIGLGYNHMNDHRLKAFTRFRNLGYNILSFVHPTAQINCQFLGEGNLVFQNVLIDFFTEVGEGNIFYPNSLIAHHNKIGNFNFFAVSCCITAHTNIGDNNFFGAHCTVGNNITVEGHSLIGAGAYVHFSMKKYQVTVPARSIILEGKKSTDYL